jgi:hypothetical protein
MGNAGEKGHNEGRRERLRRSRWAEIALKSSRNSSREQKASKKWAAEGVYRAAKGADGQGGSRKRAANGSREPSRYESEQLSRGQKRAVDMGIYVECWWWWLMRRAEVIIREEE